MNKQTSIHIEPVKQGSEQHNRRQKELDYVRKDLTHKNESWEVDTVGHRLELIKEKYKKTTGQRLQAKATPIREGVAVIDSNTTMEQLKDFAHMVDERFGIKTIQIHIHRDEGYLNSKEWKPNLHAHMVFDWTDQATGKTLKLNRQDMAEMQTILSECLGMQRGKSSSKKHLNALQYKTESEQERLQQLKGQIRANKAVFTVQNVLDGILHLNEKNTLKNENLALKNENLRLIGELDEQKGKNSQLTENIQNLQRQLNKLENAFQEQARGLRIDGERRAVKLINNLLRKNSLPEIDYRAWGEGYDNAVYLKQQQQRGKGLNL